MATETKKEKNLRIKKQTLKWLNHLADEYVGIALSYSLSDETKELNDKDSNEIDECINWVKTK